MRWMELTNKGRGKGPWTPEEDRTLTKLVALYGTRKWSKVSQYLPGRIRKQCRERWFNQLDPSIKRGKWTIDEDIVVVQLHLVRGMKWSQIAKHLPGRTDNSIKNRYNANLRRRLREEPFLTVLNAGKQNEAIQNLCLLNKDQKSMPRYPKADVKDYSVIELMFEFDNVLKES